MMEIVWNRTKNTLLWKSNSKNSKAPNSRIITMEGVELNLLDLEKNSKPLVISFGSYTWPPWRGTADLLQEIAKKYEEKANFISIYISEAHPADGWKLDQDICFKQPKTLKQRMNIAKAFVKDYDFKIPLYIDLMDNNANNDYSAIPERLYVVRNSCIEYQGGIGPTGYDLNELEKEYLERL